MKRLKRTGIVAFALSAVFAFFAFKTDYFEVAKQLEIYTSLFKELNMYYIDEINPARLTERSIDNMLNDLDPYTRFYDEQQVEEVKIISAGEYSGIGATTKYIGNKLTVLELHKDMPADKAGLKVGDEIVKVDQITITEDNKKEISALLKGAENTEVNLQVKRQGKTMNFKVQREKIDIDPVPHYQMIDDKTGYISFIKFNTKASDAVKGAFLDLKSKGMEQLILDLRGNPGGLLNEAIEITNFFIPKGETVVTTRAKLKKWSENYRTRNEPIDLEIPIVILIDGHSASAAEIVSGSLQDLDRAVILGERSFGKGLVQRYRNLPYGTKLKITISKYYTPSGRNIQELDYTHRNGNEVPKFSSKQRAVFYTKNGRKVYGGGGIEPDVKIDKPEKTPSTEALLSSDAVFNFATEYYYTHPKIAEPKDFIAGDSMYNEFIDYLENHPDSFETHSEKVFKSGYKEAGKEEYANSVSGEYQELMKKIRKEKIKDLEKNKEEILGYLNNEILNRYFYKKGEYINHIYHSRYISEAQKVLNDQNRYQKILH
jgi:carboxyl-terminal processing protease